MAICSNLTIFWFAMTSLTKFYQFPCLLLVSRGNSKLNSLLNGCIFAICLITTAMFSNVHLCMPLPLLMCWPLYAWGIYFIIHPCDPTVVICYLIWPCDMTVHITYLISHSSSLTPSVRAPPGRGGSWQPADVRTPPGRGGSLYAAVFAPLMLKCSGLLHPFIS